jgi:predicted O-methyltransferase YrrM
VEVTHRVHPDDPGEPSNGFRRIGVASEEEELLRNFARKRNVLEIGTGLGYSTRALADTAKSLTSVDIDSWVHEKIWPELPQIVRLLDEKPDELFDMVFVDGDHRKEPFLEDLSYAMAHAPLVVCHDWYEVGEYVADPQPWIEYKTTYGIGVWRG